LRIKSKEGFQIRDFYLTNSIIPEKCIIGKESKISFIQREILYPKSPCGGSIHIIL